MECDHRRHPGALRFPATGEIADSSKCRQHRKGGHDVNGIPDAKRGAVVLTAPLLVPKAGLEPARL